MSSILIVDDEELVRSAIIDTIDFNEIGFNQVWEAEDGELAYDIVAERHPDIVMTDIRMPFMDGLELSEKIKKNFPNTKIIILTGHDEFSYAKKALQLGVNDYIVKPIKPQELKELLKNASLALEGEREMRLEQTKLKRQLKESLPLLQERMLNSIISGNAVIDEKKLSALDLDILTKQNYTVCVFDNLGSRTDIEKENREARDFLHQSFSKKEGVVFLDSENRITAIFFDCSSDRAILQSSLKNHINAIKNTLGYTYIAGLGETVNSISMLNKSCSEAVSAISNRNLSSDKQQTFDYSESVSKRFVYPKTHVSDLISAIALNSGYPQPLNELRNALIEQGSVSFDNLRLVHSEVINAIYKILLFVGCEIPNDFVLTDILQTKIHSLNDMILSIEGFAKTASRLMENVKISRKRMIVENARQHIENNFSNPDLSLNSVASEVYISPSYLSMIFKKEIGESFVDYLTKIRMDCAKQMIRNADIKTYEVALKVGYRDPHYFGISFKKYSGQTPSEYKKMQV